MFQFLVTSWQMGRWIR